VSVDTLSQILNSQILEIANEDWLLQELIDFVGEDLVRFPLFETVYFEIVSVDALSKFIEFIHPFYDRITLSLWERLSRRLTCEANPPPVFFRCPGSRFASLQADKIAFEPNVRLGGIISYLTAKHGGNPAELGIVGVKSSFSELPSGRPTPSFHSMQWLELDFKDMSIHVTHYLIQPRQDQGGRLPDGWVVEVGDNGSEWSQVDRRCYRHERIGPGVQHIFPIAAPRPGRYFRVQELGPGCRCDDYFAFTSLEIFGRLLKAPT
jgi:hypothetical protein